MNHKKRLSTISIAVSAALILFSTNASAISDAEAKQLAVQAYKGNAASLQTLQQDATGGDAAAEEVYGDLFVAKKDYAQAAQWYRKAAEQGDANAQYKIGLMYDAGHGVPQDYAQAALWYKKAAAQGNATAQTSLGLLYENGHGVQQDYAQAAQWYRKAADQGNADAPNNLGVMYENGENVEQSNIIAYALYNLSASKDQSSDNHGASNRDVLAPTMTEADIEAAQALSQHMITRGVTVAIDNYAMPLHKNKHKK